ncbi:hypothetical protein [Deinococcus budaensis]|uniref:Uncharacterized protein n=1 Tax=Deinococcus budaensis TaxID=1665626 RepID=A0A7W8LNT7_9DEIO|nr:hypothetical protein [Deinococcus budaensis]MBB5232969.1 hypothetical protein [Deinococcus budaensis]
MSGPRRFLVIRVADVSGKSGTGVVMEGVVFHTGQVVVCWRSAYSSVVIFPAWEAFSAVHLDAHPENGAVVEWLD